MELGFQKLEFIQYKIDYIKKLDKKEFLTELAIIYGVCNVMDNRSIALSINLKKNMSINEHYRSHSTYDHTENIGSFSPKNRHHKHKRTHNHYSNFNDRRNLPVKEKTENEELYSARLSKSQASIEIDCQVISPKKTTEKNKSSCNLSRNKYSKNINSNFLYPNYKEHKNSNRNSDKIVTHSEIQENLRNSYKKKSAKNRKEYLIDSKKGNYGSPYNKLISSQVKKLSPQMTPLFDSNSKHSSSLEESIDILDSQLGLQSNNSNQRRYAKLNTKKVLNRQTTADADCHSPHKKEIPAEH